MSQFCAVNMSIANAWFSWRAFKIVPCTLAVVGGPIIGTIYSLSRTEYSNDDNFSISQALNGTLCLLMFLSLFLSRRLYLLELPIIRPIIFLFVYAIMTCFLSTYPYENITFAIKLVFTAFIFISAFHLSHNNLCNEYWLVYITCFNLAFIVLSQVIAFVMGNTIGQYSTYATSGFIDEASVTVCFIVATLPIFFKFFPEKRWSITGIAVVLVSVIITMRRTGIITTIFTIMVVLVYNLNPLKNIRKLKYVIFALIIMIVIPIIYLNTQAGTDLLARMSDLNPSEGTGSGRYVFWRISLNHILNRGLCEQVMGEGMGSIRSVMYENYGLEIGSHNAWLDMTHAFGLFGFAAILWWYFRLLQLAKQLHDNKNDAFQGVLTAIIIMFLFSMGQGGFNDPALALIYAALGFWMGQTLNHRRQVIRMGNDVYRCMQRVKSC